ncbi:metallophosphoesterase [Streptacidiphilus anmyonensis]|uniref:metallophosphoesterase n=1 Tax=Streptacidiphilus anmyonensis TaxID=405782 RepID=UPI0005AA6A93|nr:metallophosphoesterase [Streptacidiphilus anmyonensis]
MTRRLERITATTDVHSALGAATPLLAHLHAEREHSLLVDCGDFFEGSGYYQLGGGSIEKQILTSLYDVIAPGNHGWRHHLEPGLRELTVCANVHDDSGKPLFRRLHLADIAGRRVAVTSVISPQAFSAIPAADRAGHQVTDPAHALVQLMLGHHHEADSWVLLSHSGFEQDLLLADQCPFLDVIFAGHCHSGHYTPTAVGNTLVVKGGELASGFALAESVAHGWAAHSCPFPSTAALPAELEAIGERIADLREQLAAPKGPIGLRWRQRTPDRRELLAEIAKHLHTGPGQAAVVLNETALRPVPLGDELRLADLLSIEPFANQLVHAVLPEAAAADIPGLLAHLTARAGPLVTAPDPLPAGVHTVVTTGYLAESLLAGRPYEARLTLGQAIHRVLTNQGDPQ